GCRQRSRKGFGFRAPMSAARYARSPCSSRAFRSPPFITRWSSKIIGAPRTVVLLQPPRHVGADQLCDRSLSALGDGFEHLSVAVIEPDHLIFPEQFGQAVCPLVVSHGFDSSRSRSSRSSATTRSMVLRRTRSIPSILLLNSATSFLRKSNSSSLMASAPRTRVAQTRASQ